MGRVLGMGKPLRVLVAIAALVGASLPLAPRALAHESMIIIRKVDPAGQLLGGAAFNVSPNPYFCTYADSGPGTPGNLVRTQPYTVRDNQPVVTLIEGNLSLDVPGDQDPAAGVIKLNNVCEPNNLQGQPPSLPPIVYTITEVQPPPGFVADPAPRQVSVDFIGDVDTVTFVNGRPHIDIEKFVLVPLVTLGNELCADFGKPRKLTLQYTGDGPGASSHSQAAGKVTVTGDAGNASLVRVLATNKSSPTDPKARVYFNGNVNLDQTFMIDATAASTTRLAADTWVFIYSPLNALLETVKFHTSCSQPLFLGNQLGSIKLVGFLGQSGTGASLPSSPPGLGEDADAPPGPQATAGAAIHWNYVVTNTGNVPLTNVSVVDDRGVAVTCPKNTLAVGESMTCRAAGTAMAGQYRNVGTATGTGAGVVVMDQDPAHYFGVQPAVNKCTSSIKPQVLTMVYTGDGPAATSHSQAADKVAVTGDANDEPLVRILAQDKGNPTDPKAKVFFNGNVTLDGTFSIDATAAGVTQLPADTYVFIYTTGGALLETVKFHTSCSQPLMTGDQFGSLKLMAFVGISK